MYTNVPTWDFLLWHISSSVYGLRTTVSAFHGSLGSIQCLVGVNGLSLMCAMSYVAQSLFVLLHWEVCSGSDADYVADQSKLCRLFCCRDCMSVYAFLLLN